VRRYVARRVAALAATLVFVSALVFVVVRVLPGDPAAIILGTEGSPEALARLRESMGLNRPLAVQYVEWLGGALRGDLGRSIQYDLPVGALIVSRLPVTLPLALLAAVFMVAAALPLGVYAATHHRRGGDYLAMIVSQIGISVPQFWSGLLLILFFSVHLGWVSAGGFAGWSSGPGPALRSLLLPAVALGLFQAAVLVRATRSAVLDVLREDYVRTARAKGLSEPRVVGVHTFRNALIPVVTVAGIQLGQLMAGAIVLESVFALPGLGRLALVAIGAPRPAGGAGGGAVRRLRHRRHQLRRRPRLRVPRPAHPVRVDGPPTALPPRHVHAGCGDHADADRHGRAEHRLHTRRPAGDVHHRPAAGPVGRPPVRHRPLRARRAVARHDRFGDLDRGRPDRRRDRGRGGGAAGRAERLRGRLARRDPHAPGRRRSGFSRHSSRRCC
jgi:peptide/nickel transport system permease protein